MGDDDESKDVTEDRRKLRKQYRDLDESIIKSSCTLSAIPSAEFIDCHETINNLFKKVDNVRELGIDAKALTKLADAVESQAVKLGDISSSFNFKNFSRELRAKFALHDDLAQDSATFDWAELGANVGALFRAAPKFNVMYGPLSRELKVRKKPERRARENDEVVEVRPEVEKHLAADGDEEATTARIEVLSAELDQLRQQNDGGPIPLTNMLVDIRDPVQTIENLFDMSFLVKDKTLILSQSSNGDLFGIQRSSMAQEKGAPALQVQKKQVVLSIHMKDLKLLCKRMAAEGAPETPLHRTDPLYSALDAHAQAALMEKLADEKKAKRAKQSSSRETLN